MRTLKILPVALVYLCTREIDEPVDWMEYACLSALGFSVEENYGYLWDLGANGGVARIFGSTPFHLAASGILGLCIARARHGGGRRPLAFLGALLGVSLAHGAFDFLIVWGRGRFVWVDLLLSLAMAAVFIRMLGSVETLSPFRRLLEPAHFSCTVWFVGAYVLLCTLVYAVNTTQLTHGQAMHILTSDLWALLLLSVFLRVYTRVSIGKTKDLPRLAAAGEASSS